MRAKEISTSRAKIALYLAGSIAFVACASWGLQHADSDQWALYACLVFFGLLTVLFAWLLIRPIRILLDSEGFTLVGRPFGFPKKVRWHEIDEFFVYRLPKGGQVIGFNYLPGTNATSWMSGLNRAVGGADAILPKGWKDTPEAMAAELNTYRMQALSAGSSQS